MHREKGLECVPEVCHSESSISLRETAGLNPDVPPSQRSSPILQEISYSFGNYNTFFQLCNLSVCFVPPSCCVSSCLSQERGCGPPIGLFHPLKMCEGAQSTKLYRSHLAGPGNPISFSLPYVLLMMVGVGVGVAGQKNRTLLPSREREKVEIVKFPRLLVGLSRKTKLHNLTKMQAAALACRL